MSMLVTDCLEFISQFFISCSVLSKDRSRFLFKREVTTLKHLCGMAAWSAQHQRCNIFKSGLFDCQRLPLAISSVTSFNKTQFLSYPSNPPPSCMPIDLVTLTVCNLLDGLCNFLSYGECVSLQQCK